MCICVSIGNLNASPPKESWHPLHEAPATPANEEARLEALRSLQVVWGRGRVGVVGGREGGGDVYLHVHVHVHVHVHLHLHVYMYVHVHVHVHVHMYVHVYVHVHVHVRVISSSARTSALAV